MRNIYTLILVLTFTALSAQDNAVSLSEKYAMELDGLYKLEDYKAHKNSFVLSLETISNRPQIITPGKRKVLLDVKGSGSLRHIWETHGPGEATYELEFFVDGEKEPSIKGKLYDLILASQKIEQNYFNKTGDTIANDSYNLYLPVPFEKSLKVELVTKPSIGIVFFQLDYRLEDSSMNGIKLKQTTNTEGDLSLHYTEVQKAPKINSDNIETRIFRFRGDKTIKIDDKAIVRRLSVNSIRNNTRMKIRFDGEQSNAVDVDIADFFGSFRGVALNNKQCYFPMPFRKSMEVEIEGSSPDEEFIVEIDIQKVSDYKDNWGYFHANHTRVESSVGYLPFQVLSTKGKGKWVGMAVYDTHHDHGGGDFAVVDMNTKEPLFLHGINGEDYFSFAFFGKGENFPYSEAFDNSVGRMRVHFENPYPFSESIEVNWGVTEGLQPRSVAYWYQDTPKNLTKTQIEAQGREWEVYGPATVTALLEDGNTPDISDLNQVFEVLPAEEDLDAGKEIEAQHIVFNKVNKGNYKGWATQYASGSYVNLMYVYGHVMNRLDGLHHMGYYSRAMMAKSFILSEKRQRATIQLSFDDPIQVYLNDKLVYENNVLKDGFITENINVKLKKGENNVLLKVLDTPNNNTMWAGFSMRVMDRKGQRLK